MFRKSFEDVYFIIVATFEMNAKLVHSHDGYRHHLVSSVLELFSIAHFVKLLKELFQLFDNKFMSKNEPLEVGPQLIHGLNKVVRIVSLNHVFYFRSNVLGYEVPNILPDLAADLCFISDGRSRRAGNVFIDGTE